MEENNPTNTYPSPIGFSFWRRNRKIDPNQLELRMTFGPVRVFGFIAIAVGIERAVQLAYGAQWSSNFWATFSSIVLFLVGLALLLGYRAVNFEREFKLVRIEWRFLGFYFGRQESLSGLNRVAVSRVLNYSDYFCRERIGHRFGYMFRVTLESRHGNRSLHLATYYGRRGLALKKGMEAARFLRFDFFDTTMGARVSRKAEEVVETYAERVNQTRDPQPLPDPPSSLASKVNLDTNGKKLRIELPSARWRAGLSGRIYLNVLGLIPVWMALGFYLFDNWGQSMGTPDISNLVVLVILLASTLMIFNFQFLSPYWEAIKVDRAEVSPEGIDLISGPDSASVRHTFLPVSEIADVRIIKKQGSLLTWWYPSNVPMLEIELWNGSLYQFGRGFSKGELAWILDAAEGIFTTNSRA